MSTPMTSRIAFLAAALLIGSLAPAGAQEKAPNPVALPAEATQRETAVTADGTLAYNVRVEAVPLYDPKGEKVAEVVVTSYLLDRTDAKTRPITYAFNGGPGAASAFLNFGAIGPKRMPFGAEGTTPSDLPHLVDNAETWLGFTDLVFVDPVGTGYSRAAGATDAKDFWGVESDVDTLSRVVAKHLALRNRLMSPVYLVGESYGGFRVPRIARQLQSRDGVGVRGLVAISPVLDFAIRDGEGSSPIPWVSALPSLAASARERKGPVERADLADVEAYASGDFLADLMKGPRDAEAVDRLSARVAEFTGLDRAFVKRLGGRVDIQTFARESRRDEGKVGSLYDANVTAFDPFPSSARAQWEDPVLDGALAPLTRAAVDFYARDLGFRVDRRYELLASDVNRGWKWGSGQSLPESTSALREALALDPKLKVLVAHGATDLVTPYMESKIVLDQLPAFGDPERVKLAVYAGGHMFYARDASRAALLKDAKALFGAE
ncbi:peptidase S10 [Methylopila sp. 73B]|uniref:S10 family peptidase n=1 Tax=Methylopila sp. 73B TaxID=1120792 RepID=UPI0003A92DB9|nr:peptidase S10 [Methylopila sp. 73B]